MRREMKIASSQGVACCSRHSPCPSSELNAQKYKHNDIIKRIKEIKSAYVKQAVMRRRDIFYHHAFSVIVMLIVSMSYIVHILSSCQMENR